MSTVAKILVVVNLVLAGAFLASASNFLGYQENWKTKFANEKTRLVGEVDFQKGLVSAERTRLDDIVEEDADLKKKFGEAETAARAFERQYTMMKKAFDDTSTQLGHAAEALSKAEDTVKEQARLIDTLRGEREKLAEDRRIALDQKTASERALNEKEVQFQRQLAAGEEYRAEIEALKNDIRTAELTVEGAVARGGDVPMPQPSHSGKVLSVDNDMKIAVISLGKEDGVKIGFKYRVSRGRSYVGVLEVTDVQAKQSAGRMVGGLQQGDMRRGDSVMTR